MYDDCSSKKHEWPPVSSEPDSHGPLTEQHQHKRKPQTRSAIHGSSRGGTTEPQKRLLTPFVFTATKINVLATSDSPYCSFFQCLLLFCCSWSSVSLLLSLSVSVLIDRVSFSAHNKPSSLVQVGLKNITVCSVMMCTEVAQCDDGFLKQMWRSEKQKWGAEVVARLSFIFMVWWSYSVHTNSVTHILDLTSVVSVTCYVYTCICVALAWIRFVSCHFLLLLFFFLLLFFLREAHSHSCSYPYIHVFGLGEKDWVSWGNPHTHRTRKKKMGNSTAEELNWPSASNKKLLCHSHSFFSTYQLFGRMRRTQ